MPFGKYTSRQLRELTATLMRLKFLSPVSEETYSPMLNSLLMDIKSCASERPPVDPDRDRVLGVFAHFADDRRIREILVDLETEHYMKDRWTPDLIRGELTAAIFPMAIR
ncbi:MAG TPA: hypothetical protein ENK80_05985, partial [Rhodobacterales bacterium]|nr:hypothetical protein [Rhodobacterales bacterium]